MKEIESNANKEGFWIYYDPYELSIPGDGWETDVVYGLSHEGGIYVVKSPLSGATELCFCIAANDESGNSSINDYYGCVMMQWKDGVLTIDKNWNGGEMLILKSDDDLLEQIDLYWGYERGDHLRFYSSFEE